MLGYADPLYAKSLQEFGQPTCLPRSGGHILARPIPGTELRDAMGCYPLFACARWDQLQPDLEDLSEELVSLVVVTDPFGACSSGQLQQCFPHLMRPYKLHLVTDLSRPPSEVISKHHRDRARRALAKLDVERVEQPGTLLDDWCRLYECLRERHDVRGIQAFSRQAFALQLEMPGMVAFRATRGGETVAAHLWLVAGDVAYNHLQANSPLGHELRSGFALYRTALEFFHGRVAWLDLGAGAGVEGNAEDGLSLFKRGWSTGTRPAYLCGRIFAPERYRELSSSHGDPGVGFFPAYRAPVAK